MGVGIYVEDENKFFFNNVIVGRTAKAKFKLMYNNKVVILFFDNYQGALKLITIF